MLGSLFAHEIYLISDTETLIQTLFLLLSLPTFDDVEI